MKTLKKVWRTKRAAQQNLIYTDHAGFYSHGFTDYSPGCKL